MLMDERRFFKEQVSGFAGLGYGLWAEAVFVGRVLRVFRLFIIHSEEA